MSLPRALSKLGLCSRTQAFGRIADGRVKVNGKVSRDPTLRVSLRHDRIEVDGREGLDVREPIVIALHKPVGYMTTRSDPQGRKTVYDLLPKLDRFVFPGGRLDKDTSGLLILTDDHRLGETLTNPGSHVPKTYEVRVTPPLDRAALQSLRRGIDIGKGERSLPARVETLASAGDEELLEVTLREGKNRQVRRMMAAVGATVLELKRTAIGRFSLASLQSGAHRTLTPVERARLLST